MKGPLLNHRNPVELAYEPLSHLLWQLVSGGNHVSATEECLMRRKELIEDRGGLVPELAIVGPHV
jgi:hypothetical protein